MEIILNIGKVLCGKVLLAVLLIVMETGKKGAWFIRERVTQWKVAWLF